MVKILLVEDETTLNETLSAKLRDEGYVVFSATDGESGLELARSKSPDLAILDIMLPSLDGLTILRLIKNDQKLSNMLVMLLTARGSEADKIVGLESGADDYVVKPFGLGEFLARVRALLRRASSKSYSNSHASLSHPIFGSPLKWHKEEWSRIFVLMPFSPEFQPIYTDHIQSVARKVDMTCKRGDDFFSTRSILDEIWSAIYYSDLCIAECTGRNPNVFYEIGIAHTLGKPTILISQNIDDIPFDIRHRRAIVYDFTPRGVIRLEQALEETIKSEFFGLIE